MTSANSFLPPGIIKALILVDPVLTPPNALKTDAIWPLTKGAMIRKEAWKSRQEALASWRKNKNFYGKWEKGVLERYAAFGLKDTKEGLVALKMDREQEAVSLLVLFSGTLLIDLLQLTFLDPNLQGARGAWAKLAHVPSSVRCHFILADAAESVLFGRGIKADMLLKQGKQLKPSLKEMKGIGHLIAQEAPVELGREIANILVEWYEHKAKL